MRCRVRYFVVSVFFATVITGTIGSVRGVSRDGFVSVSDGRLVLNGKPYYFVGANYWYGGLIGLKGDRRRGIERLRSELDLLKANGVTNLRLLGGAEGSGEINGVYRVGPPLQPEQGKFHVDILRGLDIVLAEMAKRDMKAVIFFSNNWEWSGGFQQYLIWNRALDPKWLTQKPDWDQLRDNVAKFYSCEPCKRAYREQARVIMSRRNFVNGRRYVDDPTIMAWELANEPRPMRPYANDDYLKWIRETAAEIKRRDRRHLVTLGHEGSIGRQSVELFEQAHADANVDYLTIHIWPKNWGWFENGKMAEGYAVAEKKTRDYIEESVGVARRLKKPLVIEEFGLPRDGQSFDPRSPVTLRDRYFRTVFSYVRSQPEIAGANFWAFGGDAPRRGRDARLFWHPGDDFTGDPPMEEQGLYSVFSSDTSTLSMIREVSGE